MNVHGEQVERVAAKAIRTAVDALVEAGDRIAGVHSLVLELRGAASALIAPMQAVLVEASGADA